MKVALRKVLSVVAVLAASAYGAVVEPPSTAQEPPPLPVSSPQAPPTARASEPVPHPIDDPAAVILPNERIVAFYGNPRARQMGILGELPPDAMLERLDREVEAWREADPSIPVRPALHMIAVMATQSPGPDGKHRLRLPKSAIDDVLEWASRCGAIVFLDIQPGHSTVEAELRHLLPYLERPDVHLALDPEWRMLGETVPGKKIGTMRAAEVNHAIDALARLVDEHGLPPKVLVIHRFTQAMLPDAEQIREDPRVQVVLNMDGWGPPSTKIDSYRSWVARAPVEFKGFKLFYKNDKRNGSRMMTPAEVLALSPAPIYIQYQ